MSSWIVAFIIADIVITIAIVTFVIARRLKLDVNVQAQAGGVPFRDLLKLTRDWHPKIGEHLRVNWSGDPEQLPQVLATLLDELARDARTRGIAVERTTLKSVLASSVRSHRMVRGADLGRAMARVA